MLCNLKLISVAQYLKHVNNSNYDEDDRQFLAEFLTPKQTTNQNLCQKNVMKITLPENGILKIK